MKKIVFIIVMLFAFVPCGYAANYFLVSGEETKSFGHATGWAVTFNFLYVGLTLFPFTGKRIIHLLFIIFLIIASYATYLMFHHYDVESGKKIFLGMCYIVPGVVIYIYSLLSPHHPSASVAKVQKKNKEIIITKKIWSQVVSSILSPFISIWIYIWSFTPQQQRKNRLKKMGWDVDHPEVFTTYLLLHRTNNPELNCAVSLDWKHMPIHTTRSLGLLSFESQDEIQDILDAIKKDFIQTCKKNQFSMDDRTVIFNKRKYSPNDLISRIKKRTPLGMRVLMDHLKKKIIPKE